jgi:uncharacterized protein YydD (DUF2326 family)
MMDEVVFNLGLNYVLGSIMDVENKKKDTHNIGKTTFGKIIDYCLLKKVDNNSFPLSVPSLSNVTFFLELDLDDGTFFTIARTVKEKNLVSYICSDTSMRYSAIGTGWNVDVQVSKAQDVLEGKLAFSIQKGYSFRKGLEYFIRVTGEYNDIFKIEPRAKDEMWKPYVLRLLGYDDASYLKRMALADEKDELKKSIDFLETQIGKEGEKLQGLLVNARGHLSEIEQAMESLNFYQQDMDNIREMTESLDLKISLLNSDLYDKKIKVRQIENSLADQPSAFELGRVEGIYKEVGVLFPEQLRKDYQQLIAFNQEITNERKSALLSEKEALLNAIRGIEEALKKYNAERQEKLSFLKDVDVIRKYKDLAGEKSACVQTITQLEGKLEAQKQLIEKRTLLTKKERELSDIINKLAENIYSVPEQYEKTQKVFNGIIKDVLNKSAIISLKINTKNNVVIEGSIQNDDAIITDEDHGDTYKKLLCIAFDLALLKANKEHPYYRFVFHDGAFEALDDRKKENLRDVFRAFGNDGIQQIVTCIDSDIPDIDSNGKPFINNEEVVLRLDDSGKEGRLFHVAIW